MARLRQTDRLLVRLPSWLGDFVMAEPALDALALELQRGRLERLAFVAPDRFFDLLAGRFEGVERLDPEGSWRGFNAALFLDGSMRSVLNAISAGIRERWGWTHGLRSLVLTSGFRPAREGGGVPLGLGVKGRGARRLPRPFGSACNELLNSLGLAVEDRAPRLRGSSGAREAVSARLATLGLEQDEAYVALDVSARPASAKAAPASLWAQAIQGAAWRGSTRVVLLAAPGEASLARELWDLLGDDSVLLFDAPPPSLSELLAVIEGSVLFVGTDSGPRHLAGAVGRPAVVLCGPTDPRHTADHNGATQVLRIEVPCGPCHLERCPLPEPQRGRCMSEIPSVQIADALERALS